MFRKDKSPLAVIFVCRAEKHFLLIEIRRLLVMLMEVNKKCQTVITSQCWRSWFTKLSTLKIMEGAPKGEIIRENNSQHMASFSKNMANLLTVPQPLMAQTKCRRVNKFAFILLSYPHGNLPQQPKNHREMFDLLPKCAELFSHPVIHTVVILMWRNLGLVCTTLKYCYSHV